MSLIVGCACTWATQALEAGVDAVRDVLVATLNKGDLMIGLKMVSRKEPLAWRTLRLSVVRCSLSEVGDVVMPWFSQV